VGELVVADISIPDSVAQNFDIRVMLQTKKRFKVNTRKKADSNKGDYGRVLVITGSTGMTGAGCLAGTASLRSGTGLLYLGVPKTLSFIYECNLTEAVTLPWRMKTKVFD